MDARNIEPREQVSAAKKLGKSDATRLARESSSVVVSKGKKVTKFKPGGKASAEIVENLLGPTGNLRAPAMKVGKTLLVGFNEQAYRDVFD